MLERMNKKGFSVFLLDEFSLFSLSGKDAKTYLQGQITSDILSLNENQLAFSANCNPKGLVISAFWIYDLNQQFNFILPKTLQKKQLKEFEKYAIFSEVLFNSQQKIRIIGVSGRLAKEKLMAFFSQLPNEDQRAIEENSIHLLLISPEFSRFLLVFPENLIDPFLKQFSEFILESKYWFVENMNENYPVLSEETSELFLPQAINLDNLHAINFKKGCYRGQEMVARAQFRGANKRKLILLTGCSKNAPKVLDPIQLKTNENWKLTGTILSFIEIEKNQFLLQLVINQDLIDENSEIKLKDDNESNFNMINKNSN